MFEPTVVVVGNVLSQPEWRRTSNAQALVTHFRVVSHSRRMDRETGQWTDGDPFRIRVNCWRRLAEGVAASVAVGDPVVVTGRLYTRDWLDTEGQHRTTYELEATSVGHDLSRGRARFYRAKAIAAAADKGLLDPAVRGQDGAGSDDSAGIGAGLPDEAIPTFEETPVRTGGGVPGGGFEPFDPRLTLDDLDGAPDFARDPGPSAEGPSSDEPGDAESGARVAGEPDPASDGDRADGDRADGDRAGGDRADGDRVPEGEQAAPRRTRSRSARRQPVAA